MNRAVGRAKYAVRGIGRRRFIGSGLALTGGAALAAACSSSSNNNSGSSAATRAAAPAASATSAATAAAAATRAASPAAGSSPAAAAATATALPHGGVARYTEALVYDSIDVHRASGDPTLRLANKILSHLVWYANPDTGEVAADLAEKWEVPDAATYTFNVRQGVKWQNKAPANGREFVADDVKWHIERQASGLLKDGTVSAEMRRAALYKTITKIETPDKYTIKLTLDRPSGTFLDSMASYVSTLPNREATEKFESDQRTLNPDAMIGTGPYMLTQWSAGKDVQMKRNPDYFRRDQPLLDGNILPSLFEDPVALRAAFEQKQVDTYASGDQSVTKAVLDAHKGEMYEYLAAVNNTVFLSLNMNKQFKDIRLVQAVNMAFDRRGAIQAFHQGLGQVSGPVTWLQEGYAIPGTELIKVPGYRTDRAAEMKDARALWTAGGGPALGDVDIKVPQTWLAVYPDTPQIISKMLNDALGVTQFKSTQTDYNTDIIPNLSNGNFPNWFGWTSVVSSADPRNALRSTFLSTSGSNYNKVNNPALDKLLLDAIEITDLKQAVAKTRDIQNVLTENGQYGQIVLYNYISRGAVWNYFPQGVTAPVKAKASAGNPATTYNLYAGHLSGSSCYINTADPTYQGRPAASLL